MTIGWLQDGYRMVIGGVEGGYSIGGLLVGGRVAIGWG